MPGARRLRHLIVYGTLAFALAAAIVVAKSGCKSGEPFFAGGNPWGTYGGALFFVLFGWGTLGLDCLGLVFTRLGWEPSFQPSEMTDESGRHHFTLRERRWFGYPFLLIVGSFGFWLWSGVNGCEVIVGPPRGP